MTQTEIQSKTVRHTVTLEYEVAENISQTEIEESIENHLAMLGVDVVAHESVTIS